MTDTPQVPPGAPDLPAYEPTDQDLAEITAIVALLGAGGKEITTTQLRPFFRKQPRNKLTAMLEALKAGGVVREQVRKGTNGGQWAIYTLIER